MLGTIESIGKFISDAKETLSEDELRNPDIVKSCEYNAKLMYYQTYLSHTDYVPLKIIEGAATKEEYDDVLKNREEARKQISELKEDNT